MKEITLKATLEGLETVLDFINGELEEYECPVKVQIQMAVAIEEIYVNIARYAYTPDTGDVSIICNIADGKAEITFKDSGYEYNPLAKADPDTSLSADERSIGGLGIYMVKKSMDSVEYEYKDGNNILKIIKQI